MNNYLAIGLFIVENDSKQLSIFPNDVKLKIHVIDQLETCFIMAKNIAISSVSNNINKFHIRSNFHSLYHQELYKYKQKEIDDLFIEYLVPVIGYLDHPAVIKE